MSLFKGKNIFLIGLVFALLAAIPVTIYMLQKQQETKSQAVAATILSLTPSSTTTQVGKTVNLDVMIDPGTNMVSIAKLVITYDSTKLATASPGFQPDTIDGFPTTLEGPKYTDGQISVTLSVGADPTKVIQKPTKIGTITFQAIAITAPDTKVDFGNQVQVLSAGSGDRYNENVLSSKSPATIIITQGTTELSPTVTSTPGPTSPVSQNQAPVCTSLTLDRDASGAAPFSVAFTANGNDPDGTVSKVTFNFGDGPVEDVNQTGGIGTNTVSVQASHTYQNAGTFNATAVITDNQGAISTDQACTKTINVSGGVGGGGGTTPVETVAPSAPTVTPTMVPSGPGNIILGAGAVGLVLSVIGGVLLLAL